MRAKRSVLARARHRLRVIRLNRAAGVRIARSALIAESALIQTSSDGNALGGRIAIAESVTISDGAILATYGGSIEIGANCYIGPYCVLYGHGGLTIGRDVMIGAHTVIVPANHGFARTDLPMNSHPLTRKGIRIGASAWIGAGCQVLDGVSIGEGALVGAGAVVTRSIAPYAVAFGNPARLVRDRREGEEQA